MNNLFEHLSEEQLHSLMGALDTANEILDLAEAPEEELRWRARNPAYDPEIVRWLAKEAMMAEVRKVYSKDPDYSDGE
jgi:hypothetical protein